MPAGTGPLKGIAAEMATDPAFTHGAVAYRRRLTAKQLEAEVFARATRAIRIAEGGAALDRTRAVADNRRLWSAVHSVVVDPDNALPVELRSRIAGVALAMMRECDGAEPDLAILAAVNDEFAAGLWS
jgi:flagellar biosynthesis regulator FlaF